MTSKICARCSRVRQLRRGLCGACYESNRTRKVAYGRWDSNRVDAQPVRDHVNRLLAAGMSRRQIAAKAMVQREVTLRCLLTGRSERGTGPAQFLMRETAERLLALEVPQSPLEVVPDGQPIPALGAQRRLQALIADGWTKAELARRIGMSPSNFGEFMKRDHVQAGHYRAVVTLFNELQMHRGPSQRARAYGSRRGWPLPFEWDEDEIDDPDAEPVRDRHTSRSSVRERIAQVADLTRAGLSAAQIADRLGVSQRQVIRYRRERLEETA